MLGLRIDRAVLICKLRSAVGLLVGHVERVLLFGNRDWPLFLADGKHLF